jgi:hypothetical protein
MRVIHIIPSRPYGGAQILVAQLAGAQRLAGVDARVLAIYPESHTIINEKHIDSEEEQADKSLGLWRIEDIRI